MLILYCLPLWLRTNRMRIKQRLKCGCEMLSVQAYEVIHWHSDEKITILPNVLTVAKINEGRPVCSFNLDYGLSF